MPRAIPYILRLLKEEYNVDDRLVRQCVEANRHNRHSAFYYLLYKKKLLEGDLNQEQEVAQPSQETTQRKRRLIIDSLL